MELKEKLYEIEETLQKILKKYQIIFLKIQNWGVKNIKHVNI
ncbi:hypothetical protein [Fusobacterium sp. SB021]